MHRLWLGICALSLMLSGAGLTLAAETSEPKAASSATTAKTTAKKGTSHRTRKATTKGTAQSSATTPPAGVAH